jgi:hypothetical protein
MKRFSFLIISMMVFSIVLVGYAFSQEKADTTRASPHQHKYVGVKGCGVWCHDMPNMGNQIGKWKNSKHSQAYNTLGTEQAKKIAHKKRIEDPQKSEKCLVCHVTAYEAPESLKTTDYSVTEGVTCEACHGAGEHYRYLSWMYNREYAMSEGLLYPTKKDCQKCHNHKSPTYRGFDYKKALKEIAHPIVRTKMKRRGR